MSLAVLVQTFERRAAEADAIGASAPVASIYKEVVRELAPLLPIQRNGNGGAAPRANADTLLTAKAAAARLGVKPGWLYRHAATLPFVKRVGSRALRFSEQGLARYLAERRP